MATVYGNCKRLQTDEDRSKKHESVPVGVLN